MRAKGYLGIVLFLIGISLVGYTLANGPRPFAVGDSVVVIQPVQINGYLGGTTDPAYGQYTYPLGTPTITLRATAFPGFAFDHWTVNGATYSNNPYTIQNTPGGVYIVYAYFSQPGPATTTIYVSTPPTADVGVAFPFTGQLTYNGQGLGGQSIVCQALNGTVWTNLQTTSTDGNGNFAFSISLPTARTWIIRASYAGFGVYYAPCARVATVVVGTPVTYTLNLSVQGTGSVDVPLGNNVYPDGTVVTIHVLSGSLTSWTMDNVRYYTSPINVTMSQNHNVTVVFTGVTTDHVLTIEIEGQGTLNLQPGNYSYAQGTIVALNVTSGTVQYWIADGSSQQTGSIPTSITMTSDHVLIVHFATTTPSSDMPQFIAGFSLMAIGGVLTYSGRETVPKVRRKTPP